MKRCWDANPDRRPEMEVVVFMLEAIDTSMGGGMIPHDQPQGCLCFRSKFMRHGSTPVRLRQGLTHTCWLNGLREGIFGYGVELFGLEDLVHGSSGHVVGALERFKCCRKNKVDLPSAGGSGLMVEEQAPREHEGEEAMCEILTMCEVKRKAREWID
ncbi:hypothetical protein POTOM_002729 [Populus tomentosa]|uniref:Serine-threonine/tyrosine-protein kinase catalytic domain-containing protein n=1 Tax=Populus tomentosa TaxID=118781 RepID=A0A8X8IZG1_POPTO|nr:hypothetical protein POTOM_002729 [Populus tomentosa]